MHKVSRVFHPVGQGAFYSESHILDDGNTFDVVYDCGTRRRLSWLRKRVNESYSYNNSKKIDTELLFLSHFHDDHYKGIELLNPKVIILPFLDEWDKVIFWIGRELKESSFNPNLEEELHQLFPNAKILLISSIDNDPTDIPVGDIVNVNNLLSAEGKEILPSGIKLAIDDSFDWMYIPINPCLDYRTRQLFIELVEASEEIDIEELKTLNSQYFSLKKRELKEIYYAIGSPNEYSMAVYSGPNYKHLKQKFTYTNCCSYSCRICSIYDCILYRHYDDIFKAGCLYLGDINLNNQIDPLKIIYKNLGLDIQNEIGTIQVPHHGSRKNFNSNLLCKYIFPKEWVKRDPGSIIYIISVGEHNPYGHPSAKVMEEIIRSKNILKLVTDNTATAFIEFFEFERAYNKSYILDKK